MVYIIYSWRNGKFEVRNSPLNRLSTFSLKVYGCLKGVCEFGVVTGGLMGLGFGVDELLS